MKHAFEQGYIALMSAVILASVLFVISVSLGMLNFFTRFSVLEGEYKVRSSAMAETCVRVALFRIAHSPDYSGSSDVVIGNINCRIVSVFSDFAKNEVTIQTKASVSGAVTNLQVVVSLADFSILFWQELPTL